MLVVHYKKARTKTSLCLEVWPDSVRAVDSSFRADHKPSAVGGEILGKGSCKYLPVHGGHGEHLIEDASVIAINYVSIESPVGQTIRQAWRNNSYVDVTCHIDGAKGILLSS